MVDDETNAAWQLERQAAQDAAQAKSVRASMEGKINTFMTLALSGGSTREPVVGWTGEPVPEPFATALMEVFNEALPNAPIGLEDLVELLCQIAVGGAGMYEARDLLAHMAREWAYQQTGGADASDRNNPNYLFFATHIKPTLFQPNLKGN